MLKPLQKADLIKYNFISDNGKKKHYEIERNKSLYHEHAEMALKTTKDKKHVTQDNLELLASEELADSIIQESIFIHHAEDYCNISGPYEKSEDLKIMADYFAKYVMRQLFKELSTAKKKVRKKSRIINKEDKNSKMPWQKNIS